MYQKLIIIGNLGGDPEMRYMPNGTAVTNFSVATSRKWTDKATGQPASETTWFRVSVWGNQAEACNKCLAKGSKVLVEGRIKPVEIFTKQDGTPSASLEVHANEVKFLSSRDETPDTGHGYGQAIQSGGGQEDDIPF